MPRIKQEHDIGDGWSRWVQPVMSNYRMACCDCGLVHTMEFRALRKRKDQPDGSWTADSLDPDRYRVEFRVRRNPRSTAQVRRGMKPKKR